MLLHLAWGLTLFAAVLCSDDVALQIEHQKSMLTAPSMRGAPDIEASINAEIKRLQAQRTSPAYSLRVQGATQASPSHRTTNFTEHNFTQPLDHFDGTTNETFEQRYLLAMQWYDAGASKRRTSRAGREIVPVILYDGGEESIEKRTNVLDHGIVEILAKATGGIGVLLEHRYYGTSLPDRAKLGLGQDWGVDQLRWLNTRQSLQDSARFVRKMHFPGVPNDAELRVIYYGGSYAGARAAFVREMYPNQIHGAIASSAVVAATVQLPEYYYAIARGSEASCSQALQTAIAAVDKIIAPNPAEGSQQSYVNHTQAAALKKLFGLEHAPSLNDFADLLTLPLGAFQTLSWLQDGKPTPWSEFCHTLTDPTRIKHVRTNHTQELRVLGHLPRSVVGLAAYIQEHVKQHCRPDRCGMQDPERFRHDHGKLSTNKAWQFQICNEWGYYQVAPPVSNVTSSRPFPTGPKIVSARIDERWMGLNCHKGFTPGHHWTIPARPNVSAVNRIGNLGLHPSRLAIIDGQYDPWRPMTLHSDEYAYGGNRDDTRERPFKLIPDCWHHCDSDGLADPAEEPPRIRQIHNEMVAFVKAWLEE